MQWVFPYWTPPWASIIIIYRIHSQKWYRRLHHAVGGQHASPHVVTNQLWALCSLLNVSWLKQCGSRKLQLICTLSVRKEKACLLTAWALCLWTVMPTFPIGLFVSLSRSVCLPLVKHTISIHSSKTFYLAYSIFMFSAQKKIFRFFFPTKYIWLYLWF